jgi:hypothetical protein
MLAEGADYVVGVDTHGQRHSFALVDARTGAQGTQGFPWKAGQFRAIPDVRRHNRCFDHGRSPLDGVGRGGFIPDTGLRRPEGEIMRSFIYRGRWLAVVLVAAVATTVLAAAASASRRATVTSVMSGLDSPRGLAFGPKGALYVVEAGRGGTGPCVTLRGLPFCYGATGAISKLFNGKQERIVTGLPSLRPPTGEVTGPQDVVVAKGGGLDVTFGLGMDPALRGVFGSAGPSLGNLVHVRYGKVAVLADVAGYERAHNPAGGLPDANPFGLLALPDGGWLVADAGGNDLLRVGADYAISTVAIFPSRPQRPTDSVPTAAAQGPGGAFYVGELTGVPFAPGAAQIYRVTPGGPPQVFLSGFTAIIDLASDSTGNLWVLEHASAIGLGGPGILLKIAPDGTRTTVLGDLSRPSAIALGPDGAVYVANKSVTAGGGEVLKVTP